MDAVLRLTPFQSTLPAWGATHASACHGTPFKISIHAPRVGSDPSNDMGLRLFAISIHAPRVGSDVFPSQHRRNSMISIHAPRVGSDMTSVIVDYRGIFQSTLPAWGATRY